MFGLFSSSKKINMNELKSMIDRNQSINLIDVREKYEYKNGHIPKAKNIPVGNILGDPNLYLNKEKTYYIVCQSGGRSSNVVRQLTKLGFDVINVNGGTMSYSGRLEK